jgi:hypothetical protein
VPIFPLLFLFAFAGPAFAVDGVLEINQTCAVETGCFAGDSAGFPVEVSASGSYRLTSNLVVPDENTHGINLRAVAGVSATSDVSIDLNGFAIIRSGCEGVLVSCIASSGTGNGVNRTGGSSNRSISVKNGSITGMGRTGVSIGQGGQVTNLRVRWNRLDGIFGDNYSKIEDNTVYDNGGYGINFGLATLGACRNNTIVGNTLGTVNGGVDAGGNVCNGSLTCP